MPDTLTKTYAPGEYIVLFTEGFTDEPPAEDIRWVNLYAPHTEEQARAAFAQVLGPSSWSTEGYGVHIKHFEASNGRTVVADDFGKAS